MTMLVAAVCEFNREEAGASLPEYALLLVLIAVICLAVMSALGSHIRHVMMALATTL